MLFGAIEYLYHSTIHIETHTSKGNVTATGFIINLCQKNNSSIPVVITNKHVIENAIHLFFVFTLKGEDNKPLYGTSLKVQLKNFEKKCFKHPDEEIDLVAILIGDILNVAKENKKELFIAPLDTNLIPNETERQNYSVMEEIIMIGYPNNLWDEENNLPIIRKGITATHSAINFNRKKIFLTDIASFPGSSGSPIFLANINGYLDLVKQSHVIGSRIKLLGIHFAGVHHTALGEFKIIPDKMCIKTEIPNNIGAAINSKEILEIEKIIAKTFNIF